ncbi:MAG: hypothetical protein FJZ09_06540 [Candidatus Omnitrophica bacterium]|nr:hypothetical protein [Candidatus Omnitrophota bacterium]
MDFKSAEIKFILLREKLVAEKISPQQFDQEIQHLRVQAQDGFTWQPRADGMWLKWDGSSWQEAGRRIPPKLPLSKRIFRFMRRRAFQMILSAAFAWALHTYMLVVLNEGFGPSTVWGKWVNTVGNTPSSALIWALFSMLVWSFIYSLFTYGPVTAVVNFVKAPFSAFGMMTSAGVPGFGAMSMGMGMALFVSSILRLNAPANLALGVVWTFFGLSQIGQIATQYIIKGWFKIVHQAPEKFNYRAAQLIVLGLTPGFLLCSVLSPKISTGLGILFLIVGVALFFAPQTPRPTMGQISGLLLLGALTSAVYALLAWLFRDCAFADDGGAAECGGTFKQWVKCQGSGMAVARGAPPAAASAAGATIAIPINPMDPSTIPPRYELNGYVWFNPPDDEGGWQWMKKEDYLKVKSLMDQGMIWGGTKFGWMQPSDLQQAQQQYQAWQDANRQADIAFNQRIAADMKALRTQQAQAAAAQKAKQDMINYLWERQYGLVRQMNKDNASIFSSTLKDGAYYSARAAVTGVNMDGSLNIAGVGTRIGAAVYTLGLSEAAYIPTGMAFTYADGRAAGLSAADSAKAAFKQGAFEGALTLFGGKIISGGAKLAGYAGSKVAGATLYATQKIAGPAAANSLKAAGSYVSGVASNVASKGAYYGKKAVAGINYVGDTTVQMGKNVVNKGVNLFKGGTGGVGSVPAPAAGGAGSTVVPKTTPKPPPHLGDKYNQLKTALASGDEKAIAKMYAKGGMNDLSAFEKSGLLTPSEVATMNKAVQNTANQAFDTGVKNSVADFQKKTGVKVQQVMLGDSGSSASRFTKPAVRTDFDKAGVFKFDPDDVVKYAKQNCAGNVQQALDDLHQIAKSNLQGHTNQALKQEGLFHSEYLTGENDLGAKVYDRFGKPGPADSYPSNQVRVQQQNVGKTTVYNVKDGQVTGKYNTSGQATTDQEALNQAFAGDDSLLQSQLSGGSKIPPSEIKPLMQQQLKAIANPDVDLTQAAKAYQRAGKAGTLAGAQPDPALTQLANDIRKNPTAFYQNFTPQQQQIMIKHFGDGVQGMATQIGM